jgi:hypothetical protein
VEFDFDDAGAEGVLDLIQSEDAVLTVVSEGEREDEFSLQGCMSVTDRGSTIFVDSKRSTSSYLLEGKAERKQK